MDFLLEVAWKNAVVAFVLALAAAAASRVLRRPALAHALWLLVLLKLVTPPLWHVSVPWPLFQTASSVVEAGPRAKRDAPAHSEDQARREAIADAAEIAVANMNLEIPKEPVAKSPTAESLFETELPAPAAPTIAASGLSEWTAPLADVHPAFRIGWQQMVISAWATGSCAWLGLLFMRLRRFRRLTDMAAPVGVLESHRVAELAASIGLKRAPSLRLLPARVPPMTWGFGGGHCLLVPKELWNALSPCQRDALVLHELAHLRRGDHWIRYFELVVFVFHWWHPVSWWARHALQEAEEECCDAWVVRALPHSAAEYADLIVETVAYLSHRPVPALPPLASGLGQIQHVRKRLASILNRPAAPHLSTPGWIVLALVGCLLLPLIPTSAREPGNLLRSGGFTPYVGDKLPSGGPGDANAEFDRRPQGLVGTASTGLETDHGLPEEPPDEHLALLRLQLTQKEGELAEEQALLDRASKSARRGTALVSRGTASLDVLEQSLTDQKVHEARVRGREASVQELKLLIKQEESRVNRSRLSAAARGQTRSLGVQSVAAGGLNTAAKSSTQGPKALISERLDQLEKRLDNLFAEAQALRAELEHDRAKAK